MTPLRPMGHLARADVARILPRLGRQPTGPLAEAITDAAQDLMRVLGPDAASIILRGSLARGGRNPADIDLVVILADGAARPTSEPTIRPLPLPVEIGFLGRTQFLSGASGARHRFMLAHCAWTLAGEDVLPLLPPPRLDGIAIGHLRGLPRWWPVRPLDWAASMAERRLICQWLAKRLIRSLAEGEMVKRGVYSRDIWPCLQIAKLAWPSGTHGFTRIAEQAIAPDGRMATLRDMTRSASPLLEQAVRQHLGRTIHLPHLA